MTVRRIFPVLAACLAVLGGAGCSDRGAPLPAETDEPYYVQGKQLIKQGRNPEALTYFLKVIDRRGERGAAESHLEAGLIYLHHTKDPVEAYHHFRKYLDLQANSKEAAGVRGKVEDAKREFARTLPARPMDDQSVKMEAREALERLQRENEELRAQIATLRGGGSTPAARAAPMITLPPEPQPRTPALPASAPANAPIIAAPAAQPPAKPAPLLSTTPASQPAPARITTPTRPGSVAGRTHTVAPKDTLYGISMKFYGNGRQIEAIYQANRDVMKDRADVRPGMTLRIPALEGQATQRR
jgi:hypothetical protein